jgi:formylglycine-generating enzyme required for sulfatase activity
VSKEQIKKKRILNFANCSLFFVHLKGKAVSGDNRVKRGGSWNNNGQNLRSAYRNNNNPNNRNNNNGFRLVRPAQ